MVTAIPPRHATPLASVCRGGEVTVTAREGVQWVADQLERSVARLRQDGVRSPMAEEIAAAFAEGARRGALAVAGKAALPPVVEVRPSLVDPIGVAEAMKILGCEARNVRYLCAHVFESAHLVDGRWRMERAEVLARAKGKDSR